jgi:3D (Asp-Asp-Asp) domain-containing protein
MWPALTREAFLLNMYINYKLISATFAAMLCLSPVLILDQRSAKIAQSQNAGPENSPSGIILQNSCVLNGFTQNSTSSQKIKAKTASPKKMNVIITAYSSTVEETDSTPFITAQGTLVRDGIVANNSLPFGTKIRIPELYGDRIFTVEDRMNAKKSKYNFDIWFPSHDSATNFGVKRTYIEVIEI